MGGEKGKLLYAVYRALTHGLSPLIRIHLHWRRFRGLEHSVRWPERLGRTSVHRPPGRLLWFHAVSLGEGMAAIPLIKRCIEQRPDVNILMTTATLSAFKVIKNWLPDGVIYQFAPLDIPAAIDVFLGHWKPDAVVLMESELWPNLIMGASRRGVVLALVNARISEKSFKNWSRCLAVPLISLLLSKFTMIAPLSNLQAIRFQLLEASPTVTTFCGDLKYVVEEFDISDRHRRSIEDVQTQLICRKVWMASSIHKGEEEVMLGVQKRLQQVYPDLVLILVPRHPKHGQEIALKVRKEKVGIAVRSCGDKLVPGTRIYIVDTLGELRDFYKLSPIAVIGGSFLPNMAGHNLAEAAAAGCAILTGHHVGHFAHMVDEMRRIDPASVIQVAGQKELHIALSKILSDSAVLETHRSAARRAIHGLSSGIIENVWNKLNHCVLKNFNFS